MRQEDAEELQKKILSAKFNFNDFLKHTQMIAKMGSFSRLIGMIPGMNKVQLWTYGARLLAYIVIASWQMNKVHIFEDLLELFKKQLLPRFE